MILRPYQQEQVCSFVSAAKHGRRRNVGCLPTGAGKSVVIAELCRLGNRVLVVVPSLVLLDQMHRNLESMLGERVDVEQGSRRADSTPWFRSRVILASRDSLLSRQRYLGSAFNGITAVVVDECHVGMSSRLEQMLNHFEENNAYLFGLSATPYKGKGRPLRYWDRPCYVYSLREAVEDGYLVRPVCHLHEMQGLDFSFIDHVKDSWNPDILGSVLCAEQTCQEVAQMIIQTYKRQPSVVYCAHVRQARLFVDVLTRYGSKPSIVYGSQPQEERDAHMQAFLDGESRLLINVAVLSYGWDYPALRRVYFACPQRSLSRYEQRIGRATRTLTGVLEPGMSLEERQRAIANSDKPVAHIHDITDSSRSMQILSAIEVLDAKARTCKRRRRQQQEEAEGEGVDVLAKAREIDEEFLREHKEKRARLLVGVTFDNSDRNPFDDPGKSQKSKRGWRMLWGPYRGQLIRELPTDYLQSVSSRAKKPTPLVRAIRQEISQRERQRT
jgi:superfamily II DNA or RNA helicase